MSAEEKKVILTGATGFIGRHCVPLLLQRDFQVHTLSRNACLNPAPGLFQHEADLLNRAAVRNVIQRVRATHLLHAGWAMPKPDNPGLWEETLPWIEASMDLAGAFTKNGGRRIVVTGSCAEYDWDWWEKCDEESTPIRPSGPYGACKAALRLLLEQYCRNMGLQLAWTRIFFTYGPHENPERLVASVVRSLLAGKPVQCRNGMLRRDYLYVEDIAHALVQLTDSAVGGTFNIGSGEATSLGDLAREVARRIGRPELLEVAPAPDVPPRKGYLVAETRRLREAIGWAPIHSLESGLDRTVSWWKATMLPTFSAATRE